MVDGIFSLLYEPVFHKQGSHIWSTTMSHLFYRQKRGLPHMHPLGALVNRNGSDKNDSHFSRFTEIGRRPFRNCKVNMVDCVCEDFNIRQRWLLCLRVGALKHFRNNSKNILKTTDILIFVYFRRDVLGKLLLYENMKSTVGGSFHITH